MKEVVIVSAARTPVGTFLGGLSSVPATKLGAAAIKGALQKINLSADLVDEVYMGNVLQAGEGQAPAKQAMLYADLPNTIPATTINKVCASGLKAVSLAAQAIKSGDADVIVAGGMESMSNVPFYTTNLRGGHKYGNTTLVDGLAFDGLTDAYDLSAMGNCGDLCAKEYHFSREDQDNFAISSYKKATAAWEAGKFDQEIVPIEIPQRRGDAIVVSKDEQYSKVNYDKIPTLPPSFSKEGTITAANASPLNDGASALVIMSGEKAAELGLKPLAKIIGFADASQAPKEFTTAPALAVPKALKKAGITKEQVDFWEFNEAFAVVGLANAKILDLDLAKINVNGGAVALGHALGNSGSRILVTLLSVLDQNQGKYGVAAICNGGGGATALVVEKL